MNSLYVGKRFLSVSDFDKCYHDTVKIEQRPLRSEFEQELEFYEQEGLLSPFRRLVQPKTYAQLVRKTDHLPKGSPRSWQALRELEYAERHFSLFNPNETCHPFDEDHKLARYFFDPLTKPFKHWNSYVFKMLLDGHRRHISRVRHYYGYWQVYQLWAIRQSNTVKLIANLQNESIRKEIHQHDFTSVKFPRFPPSFALSQHTPGDFLGINHYFDGLSVYRNIWRREDYFTSRRYAKEVRGIRILEEQPLLDLNDRLFFHIKSIKKRYSFTEEGLFDFLKTLTELFFLIRDTGYKKLSETLQQDLIYLNEFIHFSEGHDYEAIVKNIGRVCGYQKNALDIIFPSELEESKEAAERALKSRIVRFNNSFSNKKTLKLYELKESDIEPFLSFLGDQGLDLYFHIIKELNRHWNEIRIFTEHDLFSHLRNLTSLLEVLLKKIGQNASDSQINQSFNQKQRLTLITCLDLFFYKEIWKGLLLDNWKLASFDSSKGIVDFEKKLTILIKTRQKFCNSPGHNTIVTNWLITGLVRNFTSHELQNSKVLLRDFYIEVIDAIQSCLLLTWSHARIRNNKYLARKYRKP